MDGQKAIQQGVYCLSMFVDSSAPDPLQYALRCETCHPVEHCI